MATVNFIPCKKQGRASMKGTINYVLQDFKVCIPRENLEIVHADTYTDIDENIRKQMDYSGQVRLISGKDCTPESAYNEFMATKKVFGKDNGRFFYHYDQSFEWSEKVTPKMAHEVAMKFAEENYKGFEVLVTTHVDKKHIHSHFIINSVSFENGKKLRQNPNTLKELRASSDQICQQFGLTTLKKYEKNEHSKIVSQREYRAATKGNSFKMQLMFSINACMKRSRTKQEFISNMQKLGYGVSWDNRQTICYTTPNGYKCRDNRLHDEKYLKGNMEREFRIRENSQPERRGYLGTGETLPVDRLRYPERTIDSDSESAQEQSDLDTHPLDRGEIGQSYQSDTGNRAQYAGHGTDRNRIDDEESGNQADWSDRRAEESDLTGWELSRAELESAGGKDELHTQPISADAIGNVPQTEVVDHISSGILGDTLRLADQVSKIADTDPSHHQKTKTAKEHKKGIGQREDDHSGDWEQTMY